jgi:hypothetical protein
VAAVGFDLLYKDDPISGNDFCALNYICMAFCGCKQSCTREFTVLLVHVLYVSHPSALQGTTEYARELVERFFRKYTRIDVSQIVSHTHKFCNLASNSRLEIVFEGRPKGFWSPNYKVYKYEYSQGLVVIF